MSYPDDYDQDSYYDNPYTTTANLLQEDPAFVQAQSEALSQFQPPARQVANNDEERLLRDKESAALAAAIAASAHEEELRQQQQQAEQEDRKRKRLLQEQERVALELQRQEEDQELASALEASEREAQAAVVSQQLNQQLQQKRQEFQKERYAGSWDCLQCTYVNPPYRPKCGMCDQPPPANAGILVFQEISSQNFGLELEWFVTNGKHDGYTLEWLAQELTKLGPPTVEYRGYTHETSNHWKIVTDSSVRGYNTRDLCLELVSPVLQGDPGLANVRAVMEHVRQLGIATNKTCGFHVHVDATHLRLQDLKRICQCFVALENAFDLIVTGTQKKQQLQRGTNQNPYCQSNRMAFGSRSNRQRWQLVENACNNAELVEFINPEQDRYRKLNITNLVNPNRPSTLEFRLHGGVEELREAEAWVRLLLRFCDRVTSSANDSNILQKIQSLRDDATPADELHALWELVDCPGLEQFYTMDRKLYRPNANTTKLRNPWRCRQCRRMFETSRALAQHAEATGHCK